MISTDEGRFRYFDELINIKNPVIPILCHIKNKIDGKFHNELALVYTDNETRRLIRMYGRSFAETFKECIYNVNFGKTTGMLIGMARRRYPNERWSGHTIQRLDHTTNSVYRGILRIIQEKDGIPVVVPEKRGIVANGIPAIAYLLQKKNPVIIQQEIKKHQQLQKKIEAILLEGKPMSTPLDKNVTEGFQGLSEKQEARIKNLKL